MQLFERFGADYEQVVVCHDEKVGLKAIIAIHSTVLGPSLGGTRFYPYTDEDLAMEDVLRLARGMTYKSSAAGLDLGGGKAVIIGDPTKIKTDDLLITYAKFVDSLSGRYITAEDVGTSTADMDLIHTQTPYVTGISKKNDGSGDPSPVTAWGVYNAMLAVSRFLWDEDDLTNKRVVINGVGKVGSALVDYVISGGGSVTIADINNDAISAVHGKHNVQVVDSKVAHTIESDIYAPCALGGSINTEVISKIGAQAICGAANNQLSSPDVAEQIAELGILYAPDFIVNAGGVINIAEELHGYDETKAMANTARIYDTSIKIFEMAAEQGTTTAAAANQLAEDRIAEATKSTDPIRRFPK